MSNLTDFFPSGGGGGLTPKFQEFNSSGTFTPTQALIDAGGYIEVFLVAGGGARTSNTWGGGGGEALISRMYLNSVSAISIIIGAGATVNANPGFDSTFSGSTAGGQDITAKGGHLGTDGQSNQLSPSWSAGTGSTTSISAGNGVFGYGAGGGSGGVISAKPNSGQGSRNVPAGSGYCLIKWYE